ncbi:hypothetical protein [Lachnobacterium bovis]|uniref:Uncharacterized protein n=1 Tax=Lachnobacterium bovis DSM 14045 TaxID=1122142 RepID=A0A1H3N6V2_9FIRM|nr:hypothetical protein [Lachnobacterium bovis]SDY84195.1 hypothetical protein SAMN02910414_02486 [Lachnobacterium bovis DSM 14045]SDY84380.1 hypothetical protein SAMN02910414_02489 [Lachnobacterium bovis DSM 14045]
MITLVETIVCIVAIIVAIFIFSCLLRVAMALYYSDSKIKRIISRLIFVLIAFCLVYIHFFSEEIKS